MSDKTIDVEECKRLYAQGQSLTEIGELMGCSYMTVQRRLAAEGIEIRGRGARRSRCRHVVLAMHGCGLRDDEIAETLGINRATVAKFLRSFGVVRGKGCALKNGEAAKEAAQKANRARSETAQQKLPNAFRESNGDAFELLEIGEWNRNETRLTIRCNSCGHVFERSAECALPATCPECARLESELRKSKAEAAREQARLDRLSVERTCKQCGGGFRSEHPGAEYCSKQCRGRAHAARRKKLHPRGLGSHRRRARERGVEYDSGVTMSRLLERDGLTCYICGKVCDPSDTSWGTSGPNYPTLDHVVALANGGGHTWDNVRVACGECNSRKRDLDVSDVLATA